MTCLLALLTVSLGIVFAVSRWPAVGLLALTCGLLTVVCMLNAEEREDL